MAELRARVWVSEGRNYQFAELTPAGGDLCDRTTNSGICFSGGGTRALSAGAGQLRALTELGLMTRARYISCVSGGSWLSGPYTYYRSGPSDDATFLGPITPPQDITMAGLREIDPNSIGATATQSLRNALFEALEQGVPEDRLWIEAVGQIYYQPFGLHDREAEAYFSLFEATVADIVKRNPELAGATFHTVRPDRPYLLMDGTLIGPANLAPLELDSITTFQMTPLYCGGPLAASVTFNPSDHRPSETLPVGGGFVEPFAFGGQAPAQAPQDGLVTLPRPASVFSLAAASGTSSSAFAGFVEEHRILGIDRLAPEFLYWPVRPDGGQPTINFSFGDGAVIENYGLLPLLQRGVENIVVFINTDTKLNPDYDPSTAPTASDLDSYLPPLFGFHVPSTGVSTIHNRVFEQCDFAMVVKALQAAKRAGGVAMTTTELTTRDNDWWGIDGGNQVRVCWVYLDRVTDWEALLKRRIRRKIERGNHAWLFHGPFLDFPNYKTAMENLLDIVELTPEQVNLLADLTCWGVLENASVFRDLLSS